MIKQLRFILLSFSIVLFAGCKTSTYQFTSSPIYLPFGTDGSAGKTGTYVLFGDWPQTLKSEKVKIDENSSFTRGCFTVFTGSDGNYYVKSYENAYNTSQCYSDGSKVNKKSESSFRYFKVEPIKWQLVDFRTEGTDPYLLAEEILDSGIPFYTGSTSYEMDGKTVFANNYQYSTIRSYLNNPEGFLESAFSDDAKKIIKLSEVNNSAIQMSYDGVSGINPAYVCDNTFDKVFLASTLDMISYGPYDMPNSNRIRKATDYALSKGVFQSVEEGLGGCWWLRSPSYFSNYDVRFVMDTGKMRSTDYVFDEYCGVVPVSIFTKFD